jgi:hypothetical protein
MNTIKITSDDCILCLSCGVDDDGVIVSLEDRADLAGETCSQCERESA